MQQRIFILALALLLGAGLTSATVIHVPGDQPTIQAGINATNTGDTVLVADGTYMGDGNKNLDFGGREITVTSENGAENCIINCQSSGQGVYFHSGETSSSILRGFTITLGNSSYGGGINITNASPKIVRCIIASNNGYYGGGVYISNADPTIINCTIASNTATDGGAIYSTNAAPVINSCIVALNSASG